MNTEQLNSLSYRVIGAAMDVHRELGPGLEEPDYERALSEELSTVGIQHVCQHPVPVIYKDVRLDAGYRIDVFVENVLIVELKSVEILHPIHDAQLLTYLRLSNRTLGLLVNFDVPMLKDGVHRRVMGFEESGTPEQQNKAAAFKPIFACRAVDDCSSAVIKAVIEVHRHLGPGLLKSAYEECLCYELSLAGLRFRRKAPVAVRYRDVELPKPAEIDLIVEDELPLLLASVNEISALLEARLIGRLKNGVWKHGLLANFSQKTAREGIRRLVNPNVNGD